MAEVSLLSAESGLITGSSLAETGLSEDPIMELNRKRAHHTMLCTPLASIYVTEQLNSAVRAVTLVEKATLNTYNWCASYCQLTDIVFTYLAQILHMKAVLTIKTFFATHDEQFHVHGSHIENIFCNSNLSFTQSLHEHLLRL